MSKIKLRRTYEEKGSEDGYRVLVDCLCPRGIKKEDLPYSWWGKDIAPSDELRKSFKDDKDKFHDFKISYKEELEDNNSKSDFLNKIENQLRNIIKQWF